MLSTPGKEKRPAPLQRGITLSFGINGGNGHSPCWRGEEGFMWGVCNFLRKETLRGRRYYFKVSRWRKRECTLLHWEKIQKRCRTECGKSVRIAETRGGTPYQRKFSRAGKRGEEENLALG